ncbi:phytanoyl-CoA dioxygenase family protein [Methylobacterium trifolii]|uniref:Phytanoyl-CoA dioxygenase n=1 Tax=Methylobacterium trifolii TaxID=1003092 RepID=A0ABQ4TVD7_9HYPH|nr:phytanoyl-CoA dioxygenase family protein [Methylobacterium trifolii]GJE58647.1 hypothetical protein MPOCJGCO_0729 [Methylobacterium trifolii]
MLNLFKPKALDRAQKRFWDDNGYLILPGFFDAETVAAVNAEVANVVTDRTAYPKVTADIIAGDLAGRRMKIADVPDRAFSGPIKINDLFMDSEVVTACTLSDRITRVLKELLDGDPLICNSLNFIYGSGQPAHYDSWFMPPIAKDRMAVVSICLDQYTDENGPLFVYPGSHKIAPYVFPHGGIAALGSDLGPANAYVADTTREIEPVYFYGRPGDVLIWHSQLLHGGAAIKDPTRTRRSLVTHYWRARDVPQDQRVKMTAGGYILKRDHHV